MYYFDIEKKVHKLTYILSKKEWIAPLNDEISSSLQANTDKIKINMVNALNV